VGCAFVCASCVSRLIFPVAKRSDRFRVSVAGQKKRERERKDATNNTPLSPSPALFCPKPRRQERKGSLSFVFLVKLDREYLFYSSTIRIHNPPTTTFPAHPSCFVEINPQPHLSIAVITVATLVGVKAVLASPAPISI
jgi:hypothetical protein